MRTRKTLGSLGVRESFGRAQNLIHCFGMLSFPSTQVNSGWLRTAALEAIAKAGCPVKLLLPPPDEQHDRQSLPGLGHPSAT